MVTTTRHSRCGHIQWLWLFGIPKGDINITNIYASTNSLEKVSLWKKLSGVLLHGNKSNSLGNYNLVEYNKGKSSFYSKLNLVGEILIFIHQMTTSKVIEKFLSTYQ
jgi:hypothetical protein